MVADALDDGACAGVAHSEALARAACDEEVSAGRSIEHGVADEYRLVRREPGICWRQNRDLAAVHGLRHIVVRLARQLQVHASDEPRAE